MNVSKYSEEIQENGLNHSSVLISSEKKQFNFIEEVKRKRESKIENLRKTKQNRTSELNFDEFQFLKDDK